MLPISIWMTTQERHLQHQEDKASEFLNDELVAKNHHPVYIDTYILLDSLLAPVKVEEDTEEGEKYL
jgi:hypothetical protein